MSDMPEKPDAIDALTIAKQTLKLSSLIQDATPALVKLAQAVLDLSEELASNRAALRAWLVPEQDHQHEWIPVWVSTVTPEARPPMRFEKCACGAIGVVGWDEQRHEIESIAVRDAALRAWRGSTEFKPECQQDWIERFGEASRHLSLAQIDTALRAWRRPQGEKEMPWCPDVSHSMQDGCCVRCGTVQREFAITIKCPYGSPIDESQDVWRRPQEDVKK